MAYNLASEFITRTASSLEPYLQMVRQTTILARTFGTLSLFNNQNKTILPPPPLNNVGCQDSNMSRKSCSAYRLQHCLGGAGEISF